MLENIRGILWDWNGTLLNDTELSVQTMNQMLQKRNLPPLSLDGYKNVFSFPVKDYYQKIGFDFISEPFEVPALEYIDMYNCQVQHCGLHAHAVTVLKHFQKQGIRQFILSAMEQQTLNQCLEQQEIIQYFEHVSGLDNHYATSKLLNGQELISTLNMDVNELILIGDTVHDYEVASHLGCKCVLIANGHQARHILESTGVPVIDRVKDLLP
ncbi:MAG TPA: HAD family hydrolase [Prolixibacteraceae bacterium]|nr:HAD family hydrolase [Prolixibacteraceae bacterium]